MKWLPISELSDEQKDGRWWVFSSINSPFTNNYIHQYCFDKNNSDWIDESGHCIKQLGYEVPHHAYFLSEPLPDLPKPLKMEWRKFEDEFPSSFPILVLFSDKSNFPGKFHIVEDAKWLEVNRHNRSLKKWMPIVPPEDE